MIGDKDKKDEIPADDELFDEQELSEDEMPDIGGDTLIDVSGEVEKLVARIDPKNPDEAAHQREVRKRLEELNERREMDLDNTFNFNMDEDD